MLILAQPPVIAKAMASYSLRPPASTNHAHFLFHLLKCKLSQWDYDPDSAMQQLLRTITAAPTYQL